MFGTNEPCAAERASSSRSPRAEANRKNAQRSTGPKTEAGKAISSRNSFKHGLYSKEFCLSFEDAAALDALKADLFRQHQPANPTEELLVNEMAEQYWRMRRARELERVFLDSDGILTHIAAAQRMMTAAERGFFKALNTLRELQKERGFVPQALEAESLEPEAVASEAEGPGSGDPGFVSQNGSEPLHESLEWEDETPQTLDEFLAARAARQSPAPPASSQQICPDPEIVSVAPHVS
jgi:hypothetical protein